MRDTILDFGQTVVALIIGLAEFLVKDEGAPGLVATCLILALFILSALYFRRSRRQISAIRSFQNA